MARFVRFEPVECDVSCCMRFEVYGCDAGMPWNTGDFFNFVFSMSEHTSCSLEIYVGKKSGCF